MFFIEMLTHDAADDERRRIGKANLRRMWAKKNIPPPFKLNVLPKLIYSLLVPSKEYNDENDDEEESKTHKE